MSRAIIFAAFMGIGVLTLGCDGGSIDESARRDASGSDVSLPGDADEMPRPGTARVETVVSATEAYAGESIEVTCLVSPKKFENFDTEVRVTGGAASIDGHRVTFLEEGLYRVACALVGTEVVDEEPPEVIVFPADSRLVETTVTPDALVAGESATVECRAWERDGELLSGVEFTVHLTPAVEHEIEDGVLVVTEAGVYEVACKIVDGPRDRDPPTLSVTPGEIAKVVTILDRDEMAAGEQTEALCRAEDAFGNEISGHSFYLEADERMHIDGAKLSTTVAGVHEIVCRFHDGDDERIDNVPAKLLVTAGAPVVVELVPVPARAVYRVGIQVIIERYAFDEYGNAVPDLTFSDVSVNPEEGLARLAGDTFRFEQDGAYLFSSALEDNPDLAGELILYCDGQGPIIAVDYPPRGATLDGDPGVPVTGRVTNEVSGVADVKINGFAVALDEDGVFEHEIDAVHGMNVIEVEAVDGAGQIKRSWRSFYYSDAWFPMDPADPESSYVPSGVQAFIGRESFHNEDPESLCFSRILEQLIGEIDIYPMIPRPAATERIWPCTYRIYIDSLTYGAPQIRLTPFGPTAAADTGGVAIRAVLPDLRARINVDSSGLCLRPSGTVTASSIDLRADLLIQIDPDGEAVADVEVRSVTVNDLDVRLDGFLGFLTNWLINFFENTIADMIADEFEKVIEEEVGALLSDLFTLLSIDEHFELGPLVGEGDPTVLQLRSDISLIRFTDGGGEIRLDGTMQAPHLLSRDPLGAIARGRCTGGVVGAYSLPKEFELEAAIADDLLNQALFSLWIGGALEITLSAEELAQMGADLATFGVDELAVMVHLLLPPIIEGCANDGDLLLQVGDAYIEADFIFLGQAVELGMYVQLAMDASLGIYLEDAVEVGISVGELEVFELEIVSINEAQAARRDTFANLFKNMVPILLDELGDEPFTFEIPAIDLGGLDEMLPTETWLTILPETLERVLGYTAMIGKIIAVAPPADEELPAE